MGTCEPRSSKKAVNTSGPHHLLVVRDPFSRCETEFPDGGGLGRSVLEKVAPHPQSPECVGYLSNSTAMDEHRFHASKCRRAFVYH